MTTIQLAQKGAKQFLFAKQVKDQSMIDSLEKEIQTRKFDFTHISSDYLKLKPTYFNSGCCCFNDGDITGIEIQEDCIRLIKWHAKEGVPQRIILAESAFEELLAEVIKKS